MLRFLAVSVLTLLGNAIGIIVAALLLPHFHLFADGFLWSLLFFTIAQIILGPFVLMVAVKYIPVLQGGVALVTIFIVLFLTTLVTQGLEIHTIQNWILAPLVIWLVTVLSGVLLPLVLFKKVLNKTRDNKNSNDS